MITKPNRSPFQVTYDDLVETAEARLKWLKHSGKVGWHITHEIAVQEKMIQLFKKFKKDPQVNLFDEFEKMKK